MLERTLRISGKAGAEVKAQPSHTMVTLAFLAVLGCGGGQTTDTTPTETAPLPTAGIAGSKVSVYPVTLMAADETLGWQDFFAARREGLDRVDSLIEVFLTERAPEVTWALPGELRTAARRAPGMLANPDQMGTALLRSPFEQVPDPLRSQMRNLAAVVGGRHALIPASLVFYAEPDGRGRAELTMVIVEVRMGRPEWRTVARGVGDDPWAATWDALKALVPGLP
jgi:hypothetical protein